VDVSLLGSGLWAMGQAIAVSQHLDRPWVAPPVGSHGSPTNPLSGLYRTADDRYLSLVMLQPAKFWADVCHHIGRSDLADDPRFATAELIATNTAAAVELLREAIGKRTLAEWAERFATLSGPWAPVQDTLQLRDDGQVRANEYVIRAGELNLVASPVQFDVTAPELRPAPEFAAQTEDILTELGMDWDRILTLKAAGAVT
jgi:crotonobetainyl-CoA:carnitine CoA-transferase CaiB-like acyl-CoA transferase